MKIRFQADGDLVNPETVTPHIEAFQAVLWPLMVSHPALQKSAMKSESVR